MKSKRGFTLIEVLIAIAIVGILAAIAVPAYGKYVREARRNAAKQELSKVVNVFENCYSLNQTYVGCFSGDKFSLSSDVSPYYSVDTNSKVEANDFTLWVSAIGGQKSDRAECQYMGITRSGIKMSGSKVETTKVANSSEKTNKCW